MVQLGMAIQSASCHCVRGIDEERGVRPVIVVADEFDAVGLNKGDVFGNVNDGFYSLPQRVWIPARANSFAVLSVLYETRTRSQNATTLHTIADDSCECALKLTSRFCSDQTSCRFLGEIEKQHLPCE